MVKPLSVLALLLLCACDEGKVGTAQQAKAKSPLEEGVEAFGKKDYKKAHELLLAPAEAGDVKAQEHVALLYYFGLLLSKEDRKELWKDHEQKAMPWVRKAAEGGSPRAQHLLAVCYRYARRGVDGEELSSAKREEVSVSWVRKAVDQGDLDATYTLAHWLQHALFTEKNHAEAARLLEGAASKGHIDSLLALSSIYEKGEDVAKNESKASELMLKAANLGSQLAQNQMGQRFMFGIGVPRDYVEAYKWLNLSTIQHREVIWPQVRDNLSGFSGPGEEEIRKKLESLEAKMSPAQIEKAQALSRTWVEDFRRNK